MVSLGFTTGMLVEEGRKEQEEQFKFNFFVTQGCDSIISSEDENLGVQSWDKEHKGPDEDVVEKPERAVEGALESRTELRGVLEVIMVIYIKL